MIKMTEYAERRKTLMKKIGPENVVILAGAHGVNRNYYHEYPFRQNSSFYYLTGFKEPEAVMVLLPHRKAGEFVFFNRVRNRAEEIWTGYRAGQKGACDIYGADEAFPIEDFAKQLPDLLMGREKIYYSLGLDRLYDDIVITAVNQLHAKIRSGVPTPTAFIDLRPELHEMRVIKSPAEIALMKTAAEISAKAHIRAMKFCKPGVTETQLEAEVMYEFQRNGGRFCAYTPIIGSGKNSCILHYVENDCEVKKGDMVLIDAGCEYEYYASDITRSFPANGKFSPEQKAIYEVVLAAQLKAIEISKPGISWNDIETKTIRAITEGLVDIGLLKGNIDSLIEQHAYFPFYMHRVGHFLGLDVHDAGRYKPDTDWTKLKPGMTRTIEPGIYISADIPGVDKRWHNIGIRIEDDIVITEKGNDVLSKDVPKTISEIEALMSH